MATPSVALLSVEVTYLRDLNWSLLRAGIPPVWRLSVHNQSAARAAGLRLHLWLAPYLDSDAVALPPLPPGQTHAVNVAGLPWSRRDFGAAASLTQAADAAWRLAVGDASAYLPVRVLPPDEWCCGLGRDAQGFNLDATLAVRRARVDLPASGAARVSEGDDRWRDAPPLQAAAAALVFPGAAVVTALKADMMSVLAAMRGEQRPSLDAVLAEAPEQVIQALFTALFRRYEHAYHDIEKCSFEQRSQRVRLPHEALAADPSRRHGATCVDYALLLCALLEASGLRPLFVLMAVRGGCHALAGSWLPGAKNDSLLLTDGRHLADEADAGRLVLVDITSFALGKSYAEARGEAREYLTRTDCQLCYALDVSLARAAPHNILPLPGAGQGGEHGGDFNPPDVRHALDRAGQFQARPESEKLCRFWQQERGGVLGVIAMGGSGKTVLVEHFLCELPGSSLENPAVPKRPELPPPTALFVWSFYRAPKCEEFLEQLAGYLKCDVTGRPAVGQRLAAIQAALGRRAGGRTLLVLDGAEKLQKERAVAGQFTDDAGPLGQLLQWVAGRPSGVWVVVTSRFGLTDLGEWLGRGYTEVTVDELDLAAAVALLRARGVWQGSDAALERLSADFGRHALTLTHVGGLLARFCQGDPERASELPPLENGKHFDPLAQRLARVLARYEELLSAEEVGVLKAVAAFRLPVTAEAIAGTFAQTGRPGSPGAFVKLPGKWELQGILGQLTDLRLLQEYRDASGRLCYSSHPAITQYFYSALLNDARAVHEGAAKYLEDALKERHNYLLRSAGGSRPVRVRGVGLTGAPSRGSLPTDPAVLDLLEELIYHAARSCRFEEAFALYRDNLGGFDHLGATLHEHLRGQRIIAPFLDAASPRIRDEARAEYERYRTALRSPPSP